MMTSACRGGGGWVTLLLVVSVILSGVSPALGQVTAGSVTGVVRDDAGGLVPGAAVSITNLATGIEQHGTTSAAGLYQFPNVPVGRYRIQVELTGFKTQLRSDVEVRLGATVSADFSLTVGEVTESVTVTGRGEQLELTSSQISTHVDNRRVSEIPMLGRDVQSLVLLAPGVSPTGAGVSGSGVNVIGGASNSFGQVGTSFSSNGQRARSNNFQVDGIDANDPARSGGRQPVIQDAVQELVVVQNNFSAEYGRAGGAIVNLITKSGTNQVRGSGFWFFRNESLNALNNLDAGQRDAPGFEKPPFDFDQVGGSVGGPIARNRSFFFGAYQYQKVDSLAGTSQIFVPTAAGIAALRAQVASGAASPVTLGLLEQHVPAATSVARTSIVNGQAIPLGPIVLRSLFAQDDHNFTVNIDHHMSKAGQVRGRYNFDQNSAEVPGALPQFGGTFSGRSQLFSLSYVHTFSSTVVNESRLGVTRSNQLLAYDPFDGLSEISVRELGLQIGPQTNGDKIDRNTNVQLVNSVSVALGRHFLKAGVDVRRIKTDQFALFRQRGQFIFNSFQDFATNTMRRGNAIRTFGPGIYEGRTTAFYGYVQDDFRLSPSLTLNLGARYEVQSLPGNGYFQGLNAEVQSPVFTFGAVQPDRDNIAPRLGFAWTPAFLGDERTVIRGGFSISHDYFSEIYPILQLPPEFQQTVVATADISLFLPTGLVGPTLPATPEQRRARNLGGVPIDNQFPESTTWTIGAQRELSRDLMVEARYVGSRGRFLPARLQLNSPRVIRPLPQFERPLSQGEADALPVPPAVNVARPDPLSGLYTEIGGFGDSWYHGGQFSMNKRFSHGFMVNASYTYSSFEDTVSEPLATTFATPIFPQDFDNLGADRGPSLYDRPHRLVASYVVQLPFDRLGGPHWLTEGWQIAGVTTVQSGQPYTVLNGVDSNGDNQSGNDRVNFNPAGAPGTVSLAVPIRNSGGATVGYFASDASARFQQLGAQTGLTGNLGRNTERTETTTGVDITVSKKTRLAGNRRVEFRADIFDLFNNRQFGIPTDAGNAFSALTSSFVTVSSPNFGKTQIGAGNARVIQLALRFEF